MSPFQIMTDEEMQRADEQTLRARVRELATVTSRLTAICHHLAATNEKLTTLIKLSEYSNVNLRGIRADARPKQKRAKKRAKR